MVKKSLLVPWHIKKKLTVLQEIQNWPWIFNDVPGILYIKFWTFLEAEKKAQVSKIEWEQKITEKESQKKISQIEGMWYKDIDRDSVFVCLFLIQLCVFQEENSSLNTTKS